MRFDWDPDKAKRNLAKHGVTFEEACEVFFDPLVISIDDVDHSDDEDRLQSIGMTSKRRLLFVVNVERDGDMIWIISARKASRKEVDDYEAESKERLDEQRRSGYPAYHPRTDA